MSEEKAIYRINYTKPEAFVRKTDQELQRLLATDAISYTGPEPELIKALIAYNGLNQTTVAKLLRVNVSTVRRWTAERETEQYSEIPFSAWYLLLCCAGIASFERLAA